MQATIGIKWHVGPQQRACVNPSRRRWPPTWRRTNDNNLKQVKLAMGHAKEGGMEARGANIMAASGDGRGDYFKDGWRSLENSALGVLLCATDDRVWIFRLQCVGNSRMAE